MADSSLSFFNAKQQLENEVTERQQRLVKILTTAPQESSTEKDLLEGEIKSRCIAIEKLDEQTCDCCLIQANSLKTLRVLIIGYQESLLPTLSVMYKVRVRVACTDCLHGKDSQRKIEGAATKEEIIQAIQKMPHSQVADLKRFGRWRVRGLGRASLGRTGDDLLQEAIASIFAGADNPEVGKHWHPNRVDFFGCLKGAIRNISNGWKNKFNRLEPLLEAETIPDDEGESVSTVEDAESDKPLADRHVIAKEEVERLFKRFGNDKVATAVLQARCEGVTAQQVMREQGLTAYEYGAALRRIQSQRSVLIVDEYDQMLGLLSRWLKAMDYAVVTASTAAEGLRLYRECSPFDVVIISHSLDLNGVKLATDIRKRNQLQKIIITTPYANEEDVFRRNPQGIHRHGPSWQETGSQLTTAVRPRELVHVPILKKPFLRMELVAILERFTGTETQNRESYRQRKRRSTKPRQPVPAFSRNRARTCKAQPDHPAMPMLTAALRNNG